ncbi:MAG: tetratricopeptide repeat protein [Pseudomonadota bacterium]
MAQGLWTRALGALVALCVGTAAAAQIVDDGKAALRERQAAIFAEMFERPDDLDLMFSYALVSIQLEDLEAAISTLERMLIYNKDLPRVHMELGAAYFRLGSYQTSKYYLNNVLGFQNVPPVVVAKANEFIRAIDQRTQKSVFVGSVSAGITYASNATLGPDDPTIDLFGEEAALDDEFLETDDFGARFTAQVSHFYDLGQPDSDFWRTDASIFSLHYFDETQNDIDSVQLRTGPQISLDDKQFGPKIRPFVEGDHVRFGNDALYSTFSGGVEYSDTLSDTTSVFGTLRAGYREYANGRSDSDAVVLRATGGVAYVPQSNLVLRGAAFFERIDAREDFNSTIETTLRGSATYSYDSGFEFAGRLWSLTGFVQGAYRLFDDPDPTVNDTEREDVDLRAGLRHTAYLQDGFWIAADVDGLYRESNIQNFDVDNVGVTLSVGFDF